MSHDPNRCFGCRHFEDPYYLYPCNQCDYLPDSDTNTDYDYDPDVLADLKATNELTESKAEDRRVFGKRDQQPLDFDLNVDAILKKKPSHEEGS